jgi:transposase-like protein
MNETIMKTDRRGRLRYTPEQKKTMMEAFRVSGLSAPRFATLHGVNYQTLISWIKKHRIETGAPIASPRSLQSALLSLVPAEIDHSSASSADRAMGIWPGVPLGANTPTKNWSSMHIMATLIPCTNSLSTVEKLFGTMMQGRDFLRLWVRY